MQKRTSAWISHLVIHSTTVYHMHLPRVSVKDNDRI